MSTYTARSHGQTIELARHGVRSWALLLALLPALWLMSVPAPAAAQSGEATDRPAKLDNYPLNRFVRLLDGQWQGTHVASDGNVYLGGSSHQPTLGAAFFKYDPRTQDLSVIVEDITTVVGEDPTVTPPQGKIHSPVVEHEGWIYFGTHLANYSPEGMAAYTGSHLVGYELATGKFRDLGVIHPNYTNYAALGLDPVRGKIYFYVTPFHDGEGSRLYRVDIATGEKEDFGLVAPWVNREVHGPPSYHCFVDSRGDCWLTVRGDRTLYVGRAETQTMEQLDGVLPLEGDRIGDPWVGLRNLDADRALVLMQDKVWIFDAAKVAAGEEAFTLVRDLTPAATEYLAFADGRFYWIISRGNRGREGSWLWSATLDEPTEAINHGKIVDDAGRMPEWPGDLIADGKGGVYMVGRWAVRDEDMAEFGIHRNRSNIALFFTVFDVSADLPSAE